jgi:murein hydrolase activator
MFCVVNSIFKRLIFSFIMVVLPNLAMAAGDKGIITAELLNIRSLPNMDSSVITMLPKGTQVDIIDGKDGWLKVRHNETEGYIRNLSEYVYVTPVTGTSLDGKDTAETINNYREQAGKLSQKIELSRKDLETLSREETTVLTMLNTIDTNLDAGKNRILVYRLELSELEKELQKAEILFKELEKKVDSLHEYAKKRLVALYKMNRVGTLSMLSSADSFSELLFRRQALERIFSHDEEIRKNLIQDQARLNEVLTKIKIRKEKKLELERELKKQIANMALERKKRSEVLAEVRRKKSLEQELIEAYRQAAIILDNTIVSLNATKSDDAGFTKFTSDKPFDTFKGLLNMPVNGTITTRFGSYRDKRFNLERFNSGISVQADRGEPIRAVKDGLILYAGWFKGYGKMIIIDHGQHYYTVYAHAEELFKDKGDPVESGEVIATVGDSGSISGPELYFEVRHYGKPVDPLEWIRKG